MPAHAAWDVRTSWRLLGSNGTCEGDQEGTHQSHWGISGCDEMAASLALRKIPKFNNKWLYSLLNYFYMAYKKGEGMGNRNKTTVSHKVCRTELNFSHQLWWWGWAPAEGYWVEPCISCCGPDVVESGRGTACESCGGRWCGRLCDIEDKNMASGLCVVWKVWATLYETDIPFSL